MFSSAAHGKGVSNRHWASLLKHETGVIIPRLAYSPSLILFISVEKYLLAGLLISTKYRPDKGAEPCLTIHGCSYVATPFSTEVS